MVRLVRMAMSMLVICLVANQMAMAQGQGGGRGRGFGFGGGGMFGGGSFLLMNPQVQKELKMTEEQTTKVTEIQREGRGGAGGARPNFQEMSEEERQKFFEDARKRMEETNKKVLAVLNDEQNARLKQIQLWVGGAAGLLANEEASKELKLTDDQKEAFKAINEESGNKMRELFPQGGGFGQNQTDEERATRQKKMTELRKETETECMAVLTEDQKAQFAKMRGEKFELDMSQMQFGGPGGGRRGRPNNN